jgi:squalene-hopene/tetraprenyl-beta-curcumene cyclase
MGPNTSRWLVPAFAILTAGPAAPAARAEGPAWSREATRAYLDARVGWWLDWSPAARGRGTACNSCHTTLPYALALPALARLPGAAPAPAVAQRLLDGVRKRVEKWDELAAGPAGKDVLAPISDGARREPALDAESVLNALTLVVNEPPAGGRLSDAAGRALDIMWARQQPGGAWRWLEFGLHPWEDHGDYYGAALAAVAAGSAGSRYARHDDAEIKAKYAALRKFLKAKLAEKSPLHDRALGLWAASHLTDLFTGGEKQAVIDDLFKVQGPDGGWSLRDLGKTGAGAGAPGWAIVASSPRGAESDGYATGLVVFALRRAGVSGRDERLARGLAWLSTHQAADGTWPVVYVNKERDPESNVGKFNRDAGAAFALLALSESN